MIRQTCDLEILRFGVVARAGGMEPPLQSGWVRLILRSEYNFAALGLPERNWPSRPKRPDTARPNKFLLEGVENSLAPHATSLSKSPLSN